VTNASFFNRHPKFLWAVLALVSFAIAAFWASAFLLN